MLIYIYRNNVTCTVKLIFFHNLQGYTTESVSYSSVKLLSKEKTPFLNEQHGSRDRNTYQAREKQTLYYPEKV